MRIPEQPVDQRVLDLAAPLIERLGSAAAPEAVCDAVGLVIEFWNAKVRASRFWGCSRPARLDALRRRLTGTTAGAAAFALLAERWIDLALAFDPRRVGAWSLEFGAGGELQLSCQAELPEGTEAAVPPPLERRIAIGGRLLDEVQIPISATSSRSFPLDHHGGEIEADGSVVIRTPMAIVAVLLADGVMQPKGAGRSDLLVEGRELGGMVLADVRCPEGTALADVAILVFTPAAAPAE